MKISDLKHIRLCSDYLRYACAFKCCC